MMITMLVTLYVAPDKTAEFEAMFSELTNIVRKEPGLRQYRLVRSQKSAGDYRVVETYVSAEAIEAHRNNPESKDLMRKLGTVMTARPLMEMFDEVFESA